MIRFKLVGLIITIIGGFLSYFIARTSLITYLWLTGTQLTGDQRYWVHEQGYLVFLIGIVLGVITFWMRLKNKSILTN